MDIHEGLSDSWEHDILEGTEETTKEDPDSEPMDDGGSTVDVAPAPTKKDAFEAIETLKRFCLENELMDLLSLLSSFEFKTQRELMFKMPSTRQTTIDS